MANKNFVPYEKKHQLHRLLLVCIIVNDGQGDYYVEKCHENEAYLCFSCRGKGTTTNLFSETFGMGDNKKDVVCSFIKEERWPLLKKEIDARLAVSSISKGIAFASPIDSVIGVSIYKMLTNTRFNEKVDPKEAKK